MTPAQAIKLNKKISAIINRPNPLGLDEHGYCGGKDLTTAIRASIARVRAMAQRAIESGRATDAALELFQRVEEVIMLHGPDACDSRQVDDFAEIFGDRCTNNYVPGDSPAETEEELANMECEQSIYRSAANSRPPLSIYSDCYSAMCGDRAAKERIGAKTMGDVNRIMVGAFARLTREERRADLEGLQ